MKRKGIIIIAVASRASATKGKFIVGGFEGLSHQGKIHCRWLRGPQPPEGKFIVGGFEGLSHRRELVMRLNRFLIFVMKGISICWLRSMRIN